ncbi:hypothetical protein T492DRAFT_839838 [Pavlovales sp. CCMP2436]|nr:hypothetical protein T492DRAFT_839838 [Pavlovales sp. CCMP2436]
MPPITNRLWSCAVVEDAIAVLTHSGTARDKRLRERIVAVLCALSYNGNNRQRLLPVVPLLVADANAEPPRLSKGGARSAGGNGGSGSGGGFGGWSGGVSNLSPATEPLYLARDTYYPHTGHIYGQHTYLARVWATIALANIIGPTEAEEGEFQSAGDASTTASDAGEPGGVGESRRIPQSQSGSDLLVGKPRMARLVLILESAVAGTKRVRLRELK